MDVREELLDLQIYAVESLPFGTAPESAQRAAFPHTVLRTTEELRTLSTTAVILESDHLRATVLPDLGGRVSQISVSGRDWLEQPNVLKPVKEGPRGAWLEPGIQFRIGEWYRPDGMGALSHLVSEEGLWLASHEGPISFHAFLRIEEGLQFELRCFNRSFETVQGACAITIPFAADRIAMLSPGVACAYRTVEDLGLLVEWDPIWPVGIELHKGCLAVHGLGLTEVVWSPRQLHTWSFSLRPFFGVGNPIASGGPIVVGGSASEVRLFSSTDFAGKLVVQGGDGQALEAPLVLKTGEPKPFDLSSIPGRAQAAVILDREGIEQMRIDLAGGIEVAEVAALGPPTSVGIPDAFSKGIAEREAGNDPRASLLRAATDMRHKAAAFSAVGLWHLQQQQPDQAVGWFDDSLLFNGEDHLTWWYKAVAERHAASEVERTGLLNAHFLAPLESALRAESFLSMPTTKGIEPTTVLAPLADNPALFVMVVQLYLDAGLYSDAAKLADEALSHVDLPALRYQLAYCYLQMPGTEIDAAAQIKEAAKAPLMPPIVHLNIIRRLLETFREDARLLEYAQLRHQ